MSKILLLLDHHENRRLLCDALSEHYEILLPTSDDDIDQVFDLGIIDGVALDRIWSRLEQRKLSEQPGFLPFLLVTPRQDVGMSTRHLWKSIDELIISPVERIELQARVAGLLERRRLSLEYNRIMIHHSPAAIILIDREGHIIRWNPAAERIFGWRESEVLGKKLPYISDDKEDEFNSFWNLILSGEPLMNIEVTRRRKDGSPVEIMFSATPLCDMNGTVTHVVGFVTDITERKRSEAKIQQQLQQLTALRTIDLAIIGSMDLRITLDILLDNLTAQLGVDAALILLFNPKLNTLEFATERGFRGRAISGLRLRLGEDYGGKAALERRLVSIPNLKLTERPFSKPHLTAGEDFISYYGVPLIAKGQLKGVLEVFHRTPLPPNPEWIRLLETMAGQAAIAIHDAQLLSDLQKSNIELRLAYDTTIEGWSKALDLRDKETEGHTLRVTELTVQLAREVGMKDEELMYVRWGALLHDIGKLGVPDGILLKPGELTEEEWRIMKQHPVFAYELLSSITYLQPALAIPYCHHEKWDGSGYPRKLAGEEIPLAARLFAVVDVWDALRSDRPYRKAWLYDQAVEHLRQEAGKHFDPKAVEAFFKVLKMYY